eukprot:TRINITY_DN84957_c0_g1_i1.p1 TRINITY_DN84957_c0_g1~~TRINITY_DN84957_c0_g1_i1.p1  ORF type:complete len:403 (-),score=80.74 TRINITY_DN84957_c0_g1_i1:11-1219(-)
MSWGNRGGGVSAPVGSNPFAPAPAQPVGAPAGGGRGPGQGSGDEANTGPMLGKGSELQRIYNMPHNMGHNGGLNCMIMADDRVYSGGRDEQLFVWRAEGAPGGNFQLVQDCPPIHLGSSVTALCWEPSSKWLFCGLWSGEIRAYCKEPVKEDRLQGHRRSVTCILIHSGVVISGSNEGTVRLWTFNQQTGGFQGHGQPMSNPSGPVTCAKVLNDALWVGGNSGITCFDLASLQAKGTISSQHQVTGLLQMEQHMIATFRNGEVVIYDASGSPVFKRPPMGEHQSNTAVELMMHPIANKPMLLCGQQFGYITAYDLPEFKPRGSFVCKDRSDTKAICDAKSGGMFLTGGFHGDIMVWKWGTPTAAPGGYGQSANPFAPSGAAAPVAASPFAQAPQGGGGGMMM